MAVPTATGVDELFFERHMLEDSENCLGECSARKKSSTPGRPHFPLRRRRISGRRLIAAPLTECMDVNRDLPGLAVLGSQQLEETLEGCHQAVSRLAGNPNSIFGNGAFSREKTPVTAHGCLVPRTAGTAAERHSRDFAAVLHRPKAALRARRWGNSVCPLDFTYHG